MKPCMGPICHVNSGSTENGHCAITVTFYAQGTVWNKVMDILTNWYLCVVFFCQLMLESQNKRIDDLMGRIRLQQEKLDKQNVRIRTLQSQVSTRHNKVSAVNTIAI